MKLDLSRCAPPGLELKIEKRVFGWGMVLAVLFSLSFFIHFFNELERLLYWRNGAERTLRPNAVMPDFVEVLGNALLGFVILALCMAAFILVHYAYHHQGSKSIYLMRRLPNRWELHRRCITLPLAAVLLCLAAGFLLLLIYFAVYMRATPAVCLTPGQWRKIWSVIR